MLGTASAAVSELCTDKFLLCTALAETMEAGMTVTMTVVMPHMMRTLMTGMLMPAWLMSRTMMPAWHNGVLKTSSPTAAQGLIRARSAFFLNDNHSAHFVTLDIKFWCY